MGKWDGLDTPSIDGEALGRWMDAAGLPGSRTPELSFVAGGSQNEIYEVRRGDLHAALRMPPSNAPDSRDDGILREWRIIEALSGTDVPHTPAIAACSDTSVLGRMFYLMGFIDGWSPITMDDWPEPFHSDLSQRRELAFELVDGIAVLGNVDWRASGLDDLGRPEGFHERQVDRWATWT